MLTIWNSLRKNWIKVRTITHCFLALVHIFLLRWEHFTYILSNDSNNSDLINQYILYIKEYMLFIFSSKMAKCYLMYSTNTCCSHNVHMTFIHWFIHISLLVLVVIVTLFQLFYHFSPHPGFIRCLLYLVTFLEH